MVIKQVLQSQKTNFILMSINCSGYCSTSPRFPLQGLCIHPADVGNISYWLLLAASRIRIVLSCRERSCLKPWPFPFLYALSQGHRDPAASSQFKATLKGHPCSRAPRMSVTSYSQGGPSKTMLFMYKCTARHFKI